MRSETGGRRGDYHGARFSWKKILVMAAGAGLVVGTPALAAITSSSAGASTFRAAVGYPAGQTITIAPGTGAYLQYAFVDRSGVVYWRKEYASGAWTGWSLLATTQPAETVTTLTSVSPLTWAPGSDGSTMELFAEDAGLVYVTWLTTTATHPWSAWTPMVAPGTTLDSFYWGDIVYAPGTNGHLQQIFAYTTPTGYVFEKAESAGGSWGKWSELPTRTYGFYYDGLDLTYAPGSNGSTQELIAYTETTGGIYVTWTSHGTWAPWATFRPSAATVNGPTTLTYPFYPGTTYAPGSNGSLQELFAVGNTSDVFVDWENPGGSWSGWTIMGHATTGFLHSRITYAPGSDGSVQEIFATTFTSTGGAWVNWENPGGAWAGWHSMGLTAITFDEPTSASGFTYTNVSYAPGTNGALQEIAATSATPTNPTYLQWENPGGTWSGWHLWSDTTS